MISKPWDKITKEDIEYLVSERIPESHTLEYKESLPDNSQSGKLDFLTDITAFANASGGDLIYGVKERRADGKTTGIPDGYKNLKVDINVRDEKIRWLEGLLRQGVEPGLSVKMKFMDGLAEGAVLLIRVPASWLAPHMITLCIKENLRAQFHRRHNGGNHSMDIGEIRTAFTAWEIRGQKLVTFVQNRVRQIASGLTSPPVSFRPAVILHILPPSALGLPTTLEISKVRYHQWPGAQNDFQLGPQIVHRFTFDGYLVETLSRRQGDRLLEYIQVFRNGTIESVRQLQVGHLGGDFETSIIEHTRSLLRILTHLEAPAPVFVCLSLIGVSDLPFVLPANVQNSERYYPSKPNEDLLMLPECMLDDLNFGVETALRPAFDALSQAFGVPRSYNYDEDGRWVGHGL